MPIDPRRVLLVGDPKLGPLSRQVVQAFFPEAKTLLWQIGDKGGRDAIRRTIRSGRWDILLSVYNDLIFQPEDLAAIRSPLRINLHPAIPIAGLGHDVLPLFEGHDVHGSTAHFLREAIDTGPIINVIERPLSGEATYRELRLASQVLQLKQLRWLCDLLAGCARIAEAVRVVEREVLRCGRDWLPRGYISAMDRRSLLDELRHSEPGHRAFVGEALRPNLEALPPEIVLPRRRPTDLSDHREHRNESVIGPV